MFPKDFSLGDLANRIFKHYPSLRFRDRDNLVHNASDAAKCRRQITYKALGYSESNPVDNIGQFRLRFGTWLEKGMIYDIFNKLGAFGVLLLSSQGDCGEHGTFYGTSWHGYRDLDLALRQKDGKYKPFVVEIKTKVGFGAQMMVKETPYSRKYKVPTPDQTWGYSQQISLYLRDAYRKTKDNPAFSSPIKDGILLQLLYADKLACFVEFYFSYDETLDETVCYHVHCSEIPEICSDLDIHISLKDIAERWKDADECIQQNTLAPPDYERKYDIADPRVVQATKTDLDKAKDDKLLIGDMQCKYCPFRDKCASDLKIDLNYSADEKKIIKNILKTR